MLKNKTALEAKIGEKTFQFVCDAEATVGEIFDGLYHLRSHVLDVMNKQKQQDAEHVQQVEVEKSDDAS